MNRKAFTLIELLVVVAIIGILAAVGVVAYNGYTKAAKINAVKHNFKEIVNFINLNYTKCDLGEPVMMNDQSGNSKDVTNSYCNNSPLGACHILIAHFKSLKWKNNKWLTKTNNQTFCSQYVICCTGSRDRKNPHLPKFKGEKNYKGKIVHTQNWDNTNCKDKNVTIVGSGCTAITMAPSIIKDAKKVTLVQRSPAWIINIDSKERSTRNYKTIQVLWDYFSSRIFKKFQRKKKISKNSYYNKTTTPSYDYWDQRPASSLDNDYFNAVKSKKVTVVRQGISEWVKNGVRLNNGEIVDSDITIMATGGTTQLLGGIDIFINNKKININDTSWYRGMMFSGIPNLFAHAGYINFSWTARCEIVSDRICRTIQYIKKKKLNSCTPKYLGEKSKPSIQANYVLRAMDQFPNRTYKFYQNYIIEYISFKYTKINDGAVDFS